MKNMNAFDSVFSMRKFAPNDIPFEAYQRCQIKFASVELKLCFLKNSDFDMSKTHAIS